MKPHSTSLEGGERKVLAFTKEMECCSCFEETDSTLSPCKHPLCEQCSQKWLSKVPTCPFCRGSVLSLSLFQEECVDTKTISLHEEGSHAGITVSDVEGGVLLRNVFSGDMASRCGLKRGETITHMNGIPVTSHFNAARIVNTCTEARRDVVCRMGGKKKKKSLFSNEITQPLLSSVVFRA